MKVPFCILILICFAANIEAQNIRVPVGEYDTVYTQTQSKTTISIPCNKGGNGSCVYHYPILSLPNPSSPFITYSNSVFFFADKPGSFSTEVKILWAIDTPYCNNCQYFLADSFSLSTSSYYDSTIKIRDNHAGEFYVFYPDSAMMTFIPKNEDSAFTIYNNLPEEVTVDSCRIEIDSGAKISLSSQLVDTSKNVNFTIAPFSRSSFDIRMTSSKHALPNKDTIFGLITFHAKSATVDTVVKFIKPFLFFPLKSDDVKVWTDVKHDLKISPNPSSGSIQVFCDLKKYASMRLHIFNELGKDIMTVFDGMAAEGLHDFSFKLPSGMYYARMETAEGVVTKKIIVE
jgi:hypothetical protein